MASQLNGSINNSDEEDFFLAMQMASCVAVPWTLKAAVDLEVFDIIAKAGPGAYLSASEIVSHIPTRNPEAAHMLDRILCLLVSHGLLKCSPATLENGSVERTYGLESVCKYLVKREDGVSLSWFVLLALHKEYSDTWPHLKDAVVEGGVPFDKVHGFSAFEYYRKEPKVGKIFNLTQVSLTAIVMEKMVEVYKGFEGLKSLVDVGGGIGTIISFVTKKYPSMKVINFDLPHVVEQASPIPGVEHVGGDMFVSIPKAEAAFMKSVIHNWSDEHCLKILRNCYQALPDHGKVIIMDLISPQVPEAKASMRTFYQCDIVMMGFLHGGKERTEEDLKALAKEAGFASVKRVCCAFDYWIIELHKSM